MTTMTANQSSNKRKSTTAGLNTSTRPVKRRASKACQCCRSRKVRCDVVESGIPCTNCRLDEVECLVTEGKRRKKSCVDNEILQRSPVESIEEKDDLPQFPMFDDIDGIQDLSSLPCNGHSQDLQSAAVHSHDFATHRPHMLYQQQTHRLTPEERTRRLSIMSQSKIPFMNAQLFHQAAFPSPPVVQPVTLPRFLPPVPDRILSEDIDYLRKKGVFTIPDAGFRNELLRTYAQYVHPYLPLLDLQDFLTAIEKNDGSSTVSLLLFQAVMFAATAFIDMRFLNAQGYDTRKAARKAFFQRVKLLYDFDGEVDRVTVVQSVLLMTYWYESPDDPKDIWHWLGVAISLARTIGLNCNTSNSPLSASKQKLWKRIWWSCYMRDRLIALGMRRPIRIRDDEADVPMLEVGDFETGAFSSDVCRMLGGCSVIRDASKRELLAKMCISIVRCCQCITRVLATQYSMQGHRLGATQETTMRLVPRKSVAEPAQVIRCDRELELWYNALPMDLRYFSSESSRERNVRNDGEVLNLHRALLTGLYLTASSALHRPQMMPAMPGLVVPELKDLSKKRVREAAAGITDIFRDLYSHDLIRYLPNTGVTILLPAIIIHLLDIKSPDSVTRQLSVRRFQFCMQALQKLRDMYASADFAFTFLDAAIKRAEVPIHDASSLSQCNDSFASNASPKRGLQRVPKQLTPPPDATMTAALENNFVFPMATMSDDVSKSDMFTALTPPSSDRSLSSGEVNNHAGAAISLADIEHMHNSPAASMHSIRSEYHNILRPGSGSGYVEADQLQEQRQEDLIDEEAMKNDFDQLINLEGGSGGATTLFTETLQSSTVDNDHNLLAGIDWLAQEQTVAPPDAQKHHVTSIVTKHQQTGIVMPANDPNERDPPMLGAQLQNEKDIAARLRNEIVSADADVDEMNLNDTSRL